MKYLLLCMITYKSLDLMLLKPADIVHVSQTPCFWISVGIGQQKRKVSNICLLNK